MLTKQQINWAKQHDWFSHDQDDDSIVCVDRIVSVKDGAVTNAAIVFSNFKELRNA